jgi:PAS domain S-box-containing protein
MRRAAREHQEHLERLNARQDAAVQRLDRIRQTLPDSLHLLVEELQVRDEELQATAEQLGEQLESLRQAVALLDRERSKYVDLFEHAPDAYVVTNLSGTIDEANVAAGALFRADVEFLRGRSLISFVARGDTDAFRSLLRRVQTLDQATPHETMRMVLRMRPRGQPVFVAFVHVGILSGADGRPLAVRWVLRKLEANDETTSNGAALADLAGSLAEDLRVPLIPIIEWARCLREWDVRDEEERRKALGWIERSADAQRAKLDELAEFARVYRETPEAEVVDVLEAAHHIARAEGEWSRVALRSEVGLARLRVLASGLPRALDLFLQRALEGTPRQENVELQIRAHGDEVLVNIVAPPGSRIPDGWSVRTATAVRIVERSRGRALSVDEGPSMGLRLPRLP